MTTHASNLQDFTKTSHFALYIAEEYSLLLKMIFGLRPSLALVENYKNSPLALNIKQKIVLFGSVLSVYICVSRFVRARVS